MKELGLSSVQLGLCLSGFTIGYALLNFPGGFIAQQYSSRKVISIILVLWSVMTIVTGMAWGFASLITIRILFGMCEGPMCPGITKLINSWVLPYERATATATWAVAMPLGAIFGNILSGYIIVNFGWQTVFYMYGGGGLVLAIAMWRFLADTPGEHPAVSKEELAFIESHNDAATVKTSGSTLGTLLRDPAIYVLFCVSFAYNLNVWAGQTWLPTYFVKARASSLRSSGFLSSLPWVVSAVGIVVLGWASDHCFGRWRSPWIVASLFIMVPSTIYAVLAPSIVTCLVGFSITLFFSFGISPVCFAYVMDTYKPDDVAKVSGMMLSAGSSSGIVAPSLIGIVLKETGEFHYAYYVFAATALLVGFLSLLLVKRESMVRARERHRSPSLTG
jgi:MFS transporter, ACS family, hexuronate transporter